MPEKALWHMAGDCDRPRATIPSPERNKAVNRLKEQAYVCGGAIRTLEAAIFPVRSMPSS
jgi:hypothetical protein